jgi:hypothetical protein
MIIIRYCNYNYYQQKEFGLIDNYRKKKISKLKKDISKDYNEIIESNDNIAKLRKENVLKDDFMKKNGATKEELNKAKDTLLNKSLKTYKNTAIINRLRPRKDVIQIPSRRNKTTLEDDFDGLKNWKKGGKKK